ncbi:hypothetical protein MKK50_18200 [Methylobacterium sp. J-043]|nr:hypothetical protein [Methylobacterium sp. J-043]
MPISPEQLTGSSTFAVGGMKVTARRMKPLSVIHVARRLAPVLLAVQTMRAGRGDDIADKTSAVKFDPANPEDALRAAREIAAMESPARTSVSFEPLVEALAELSDADTNHVLEACLSQCQFVGRFGEPRRAWEVVPGHAGNPAADLTAGEILSIAGHVLAATFNELMDDLPNLGLPGFDGGAGGAT